MSEVANTEATTEVKHRVRTEKLHEVQDSITGQTQIYRSYTKAQAVADAIGGIVRSARERFTVREVGSNEILKLAAQAASEGVSLESKILDLTAAAPVAKPEEAPVEA